MKYEILTATGERFLIQKEWTKVGRAADNDVVVLNPTVSRYHLNIYLTQNGIVAENAGSNAGFFVNNVQVYESQTVQLGDSIYIGNTFIQIVREGSAIYSKSKKEPVQEALYESASEAAVKKSSNPENTKRIIIYSLLAGFMAFMFLSEDPADKSRSPASEQTPNFGLDPLPANSYQKNTHILKSETAIRAEGKFQEGLRDYYNENFGRARLAFQEAMEFEPSHQKSIEYLAKTESQMLESINASIKDAEQSFGLGQLRRARWQAGRALEIISQQIPGYARKLAQESDADYIKRTASQGQEESLLKIPCGQSQYEKKCQTALNILQESRRALGDEDVIRRYEQ